MAHNPLIEEILASVDIVDVVSKYVSLRRAGSNFSGCCPFHNEKTPSFMVSPAKQIYKCFGCGKGGNVIGFVQEIERIDFWEALKELADRYHIDMQKYQIDTQKIAADNDEKVKIKRMYVLTHRFFQEALEENQLAKRYLIEQRHLTQEMISRFGIGYAPDRYQALPQFLKTKGFSDEDLISASLAKRNANGELYTFFRNRITFPIFDAMGSVIAFSARVINPEDKPKYLNSAEHKAFEKSKVLYGLNFAKNAIKEHQKLIVVEGQMDVLGLARLDHPVGIATSGTALSLDHIKLIKRYTENVYLLFDSDDAGNQATLRALKLFYQQNIFPKIIQLPSGFKDADELANTPNGKSDFLTCLSQARDGFLTVYGRLRERFDMTSPIDKQKLITMMFELIVSVNSLTIQEHYKQLLSEQLGFAPEILDAQFKQYKNKEGRIFLEQQKRQIEQENAQKYQMERDFLYVSLFYQQAISQYLQGYEKLQFLLAFVELLAQGEEDSLLSKVIRGKLDENTEKEVRESSLWWDDKLLAFPELDKKYQFIMQILTPFLQNQLQWALKNPSISMSIKQHLLQVRNTL